MCSRNMYEDLSTVTEACTFESNYLVVHLVWCWGHTNLDQPEGLWLSVYLREDKKQGGGAVLLLITLCVCELMISLSQKIQAVWS